MPSEFVCVVTEHSRTFPTLKVQLETRLGTIVTHKSVFGGRVGVMSATQIAQKSF